MNVWTLIKADLHRHTERSNKRSLIVNLLNQNRSFKYCFWLRLRNHHSLLVRLIAGLMHRHLSIKYQIQIPKEVKIGPGLHLGHATSIIINATATIGSNCNISQFVTIGSNHGRAAKIGDCCYIGPNVCIVENVTIGNFSTIGAGCVVTKNIPENSTAVGNPARYFESKHPASFIKNRYVHHSTFQTSNAHYK